MRGRRCCSPCERAARFGAPVDTSDALVLIARVGASLGLRGPSDPIGRLGPAAISMGRTLANPCGGQTFCTDADVLAWLKEAKTWTDYAGKLRDENVILSFGKDPAKWPEKAKLGEVLYRAARDRVGGEPGFLDSSQASTYAQAVFLAKASFEFFLRSIEDLQGIPEQPLGPNLTDDPIRNRENLPPYIPFPDILPSFPSLTGIGLLLGGVLLVWLLVRSGGERR